MLKVGTKPADIPAQLPKNLKFVVNNEAAERMGVTIKDEWKAEFTE